MGADVGGRAGDKGTSGERRVRKLAKLSAQGTLQEAVRSAGWGQRRRSGDWGTGGTTGSSAEAGSRDPDSGSRERGSGSRESGLGSGERGTRSREPDGLERTAELGLLAAARRDRTRRRGPEAASGPGEGPCPRGPHSPARPARARPSAPTRARPHRPHGLLQQCPKPAQHDGGPARLAARLSVAARRWRRRRPNRREAGPGPETPPLPEGAGRSKPRAGQVLKESQWWRGVLGR